MYRKPCNIVLIYKCNNAITTIIGTVIILNLGDKISGLCHAEVYPGRVWDGGDNNFNDDDDYDEMT